MMQGGVSKSKCLGIITFVKQPRRSESQGILTGKEASPWSHPVFAHLKQVSLAWLCVQVSSHLAAPEAAGDLSWRLPLLLSQGWASEPDLTPKVMNLVLSPQEFTQAPRVLWPGPLVFLLSRSSPSHFQFQAPSLSQAQTFHTNLGGLLDSRHTSD